MAHGIGGIKSAGLAPIAERFADGGHTCVVFDYRHFGTSEGFPRERLSIRAERDDYRAANRVCAPVTRNRSHRGLGLLVRRAACHLARHQPTAVGRGHRRVSTRGRGTRDILQARRALGAAPGVRTARRAGLGAETTAALCVNQRGRGRLWCAARARFDPGPRHPGPRRRVELAESGDCPQPTGHRVLPTGAAIGPRSVPCSAGGARDRHPPCPPVRPCARRSLRASASFAATAATTTSIPVAATTST